MRRAAPAPSTSTPAPGAPASVAPAQATPSPAPGATGTPGPRVLIGGQLIDPRTGMPVVVPPGQQPMPGTVPGAQPGVVLGATPGVPGAQSPPGVVLGATPVPGGVPGDSIRSIQEQARQAAAAVMERDNSTDGSMATARIADAKFRLDIATVQRNRYQIEIHKKFSLALACLVFVILGAPMALRFQRGGVGLVFLVSLAVFALYYVGLIGGEALANKGIIPPFWSMWGMNVFLATVGMVLLFRMGREENSGRGGGLGERVDRWRDAVRARRSRRLVKEPA